jgi:hypothetical protein
LDAFERGCDIIRSSDFHCGGIEAEHIRRCLNLAHLQYGGGIANISHDRQLAEIGENLPHKSESFASKIGRLDRQASDISTRARQIADEATANRVRRDREHDRNDRCRLLC